MKYTNLYSKIAIIVLIFLSACNTENNKTTKLENNSSINRTTSKKQLRHVVLFKFKDNVAPEAISKAEKAFSALPSKIPQIKDFEWGINNSPEGISKGFAHCYFLTFDSEEDRAIYLPHPDHKAFGKIIHPILEDVLVVDYWVKE